jgi:hypothetical protein
MASALHRKCKRERAHDEAGQRVGQGKGREEFVREKQPIPQHLLAARAGLDIERAQELLWVALKRRLEHGQLDTILVKAITRDGEGGRHQHSGQGR